MDNYSLQKLFHKTFRTSLKRVKRRLHAHGLSKGQPEMLEYLAKNDGCIQKEVADNCNLEPATVTSVLGNMEKSGFIKRESNPKDRRILNVYLTEKGKEAQKKAADVITEIGEDNFKGFTEEEKLQFSGYLNRILENIEGKE